MNTWSPTYSIPKLGLKLLNNETKTSRDLMQHGVAESPMRLRWDLLLRMPRGHFQFHKRVKVIWVSQNRPQTAHFSLSTRFQTHRASSDLSPGQIAEQMRDSWNGSPILQLTTTMSRREKKNPNDSSPNVAGGRGQLLQLNEGLFSETWLSLYVKEEKQVLREGVAAGRGV